MRVLSSSLLVLGLFVMGCDAEMGEQRSSGSSSGGAPATSGGESITSAGGGAAGDAEAGSDAGTGEAAEPGEVALTPDNTDIVFIGTHADPNKPDPRTCEFTDFEGTASINPDSGELTAIDVTIQTAEITTFNDMLTNHLKGPDFFDTAEFPQATFASTSIEPGEEEGTVTITGDLTLLGETKPVTFPATVSTADGLTLNADFTIDRTEWGMDYGTDNVLKEVQLQISIGG